MNDYEATSVMCILLSYTAQILCGIKMERFALADKGKYALK